MNKFEKEICNICIRDSKINKFCVDEWDYFSRHFPKSCAFEMFIRYLSCHFIDLFHDDYPRIVNRLLTDVYNDLDFYEISKYVINSFDTNCVIIA